MRAIAPAAAFSGIHIQIRTGGPKTLPDRTGEFMMEAISFTATPAPAAFRDGRFSLTIQRRSGGQQTH
jgi:hypothetical protein